MFTGLAVCNNWLKPKKLSYHISFQNGSVLILKTTSLCKNWSSMPASTLPRSPIPSRIPSLDGLRALSIFLVVALHTLQRYNTHHHVWPIWYAVFNGESGVFIFFEISGFLITNLLLKEHEKHGRISLRGFYLRRVFRILPPLYFYIATVVLLGLAGSLVLNKRDIISGLLFLHNIDIGQTMWAMQHLWSISVEEQFYLWWPLLLIFCLRRPGVAGRFLATRVPIAILLISPIARTILGASRNHPTLHRIGVNYLDFDFLMFGCLCALLQHTPRFEAIYRFATRVWWLPLLIMAICSLLATRYQNYFNLPIGFTINGAAIAMFLLWCTRNPLSSVGRILNWGPIVRVGVLSYSIYIWQTLFLHPANLSVFGRVPWLVVFPASWLVCFLVANFSYHVVEQPSLRLRTKVIRFLNFYMQRRSPEHPPRKQSV